MSELADELKFGKKNTWIKIRMQCEKDLIVYFTKLKRDISAKTFIFLVKRFANLKCTDTLSEEFP